ncbi:hypothetical protein C8F01DRAFT_1083137 [Mycena amicta]|nr:hypothetical protein C8F01DRAFT_1083137 [Mycena amicta]
MSAEGPRLPPELEHEIFAIAAILDQCCIPDLLLVARRVHVCLNLSVPGQLRALLHVSSAKPPSFLASAVRHVIFDIGEDSNSQPEAYTSALRLCTGVTHIAVSAARDNLISDVLAIMSLMHIERFAGSIARLFNRPQQRQRAIGASIFDLFDDPPMQPMDPQYPAFRFLTHLEVFDNLNSDEMEAFIVSLPSLTHVATGSVLPSERARRLLKGCSNLRVMVFLRGYVPLVDDPRIVVCNYTDWAEAAALAPKRTYWDVVEEFLEKKSRGEVRGYRAIAQ